MPLRPLFLTKTDAFSVNPLGKTNTRTPREILSREFLGTIAKTRAFRFRVLPTLPAPDCGTASGAESWAPRPPTRPLPVAGGPAAALGAPGARTRRRGGSEQPNPRRMPGPLRCLRPKGSFTSFPEDKGGLCWPGLPASCLVMGVGGREAGACSLPATADDRLPVKSACRGLGWQQSIRDGALRLLPSSFGSLRFSAGRDPWSGGASARVWKRGRTGYFPAAPRVSHVDVRPHTDRPLLSTPPRPTRLKGAAPTCAPSRPPRPRPVPAAPSLPPRAQRGQSTRPGSVPRVPSLVPPRGGFRWCRDLHTRPRDRRGE